MPTYVYACDTCGKQFEQFQSFKDAPLDTCPCGEHSNAVRRVFQPVGIVFKGSGWYVTDSRNSSSSSITSDKKSSSSDNDATTSSDKADKTDKADKADKADTSGTSASSGSTSPASSE